MGKKKLELVADATALISHGKITSAKMVDAYQYIQEQLIAIANSEHSSPSLKLASQHLANNIIPEQIQFIENTELF
jgi:hypothetical protein